ncbi:MAG: ester cyclase [Chloroflexi bacterium]|nr:ester cyclase [Chloroflexota bacterium]
MTHDLISYIQRLTNAWNSHDLEQVLPYYSEEYEGVDIGEPQLQRGRKAVKAMLLRYWGAFPDLQFTVENTVAEAGRIAISWLAEGTQQGLIMNIPPTGRKVEIRGVSVIDVKDGLVVRGEYIWDLAGMLRSLGLLPQL